MQLQVQQQRKQRELLQKQQVHQEHQQHSSPEQPEEQQQEEYYQQQEDQEQQFKEQREGQQQLFQQQQQQLLLHHKTFPEQQHQSTNISLKNYHHFKINKIVPNEAPTYTCTLCQATLGDKGKSCTKKLVESAFYRHLAQFHPRDFYSLPLQYVTSDNTEVTMMVGAKFSADNREFPPGVKERFEFIKAKKRQARAVKQVFLFFFQVSFFFFLTSCFVQQKRKGGLSGDDDDSDDSDDSDERPARKKEREKESWKVDSPKKKKGRKRKERDGEGKGGQGGPIPIRYPYDPDLYDDRWKKWDDVFEEHGKLKKEVVKTCKETFEPKKEQKLDYIDGAIQTECKPDMIRKLKSVFLFFFNFNFNFSI